MNQYAKKLQWCDNDVITESNGKVRTLEKLDKLFIVESYSKIYFLFDFSDKIQTYGHLVGILSHFVMTSYQIRSNHVTGIETCSMKIISTDAVFAYTKSQKVSYPYCQRV